MKINNSNPLDQFEIKDFLSINAPILANSYININNMSLYLSIAVLLVLTFNILAINFNKITSNY